MIGIQRATIYSVAQIKHKWFPKYWTWWVLPIRCSQTFLKYAIDDTMRISGDHDGLAGTIFVGDTYEKNSR